MALIGQRTTQPPSLHETTRRAIRDSGFHRRQPCRRFEDSCGPLDGAASNLIAPHAARAFFEAVLRFARRAPLIPESAHSNLIADSIFVHNRN